MLGEEQLGRLRGTLLFPKGVDKAHCLQSGGYLDLFSGVCGTARELNRLSSRWVLTYELSRSALQDLADAETQREVEELMDLGVFVGVGASPACSSMSRAVTPSLRSSSEPLGVSGLSSQQRRQVLQITLWLLSYPESARARMLQGFLFWVENPVASYLWLLPCFGALSQAEGAGFWVCDLCAFGTSWRKRTRILTNTDLRGKRTACPGCHRHQSLRGCSPFDRKSWSKVAEPFPRGLCLVLGMALAAATGDRPEFLSLDSSACARSANKRIGEASHP